MVMPASAQRAPRIRFKLKVIAVIFQNKGRTAGFSNDTTGQI
jgi:hypothetical protein